LRLAYQFSAHVQETLPPTALVVSKIRELLEKRLMMSCSAAPIRSVRTTAMWRGWRHCLPRAAGGGIINRLCGSGLDAIMTAARAVRAGEADLIIAGGVESMLLAPFCHAEGGGSLSPPCRNP